MASRLALADLPWGTDLSLKQVITSLALLGLLYVCLRSPLRQLDVVPDKWM